MCIYKFYASNLHSPVWTKLLTIPEESTLNRLIATNDGGFAIVGNYFSHWADGVYGDYSHAWMINLDNYGNVKFTYQFENSSRVDYYIQTSDSGYIFANATCIRKTDSNLNLQWNKSITDKSEISITLITKTSDGGYALALSYHGPADKRAVGLAKVNNSGDLQWTKWYDGAYVSNLIQTKDGGYALVGEIYLGWSSTTGGYAFLGVMPSGWDELPWGWVGGYYGLFIKIDANGDAEGQITMPTPTPASILPSNSLPLNQSVVLDISSNSTISAFKVNNTIPSINFVVSGPAGTTGYVNITIDKSFMSNSDAKVFLDGNETSYQFEEKANSFVITFIYPHSESQMPILIDASNIENSKGPEWFWQVTLISVVSCLVAVGCIVFWLAKKKA